MQEIIDITIGLSSLSAAIYCIVLAKRLKRFAGLESGMGGAIAVLSSQVDDLTNALNRAEKSAAESANTLQGLTLRAENSSKHLELMLAAMHDLPTNIDGSQRRRSIKRRAQISNDEML